MKQVSDKEKIRKSKYEVFKRAQLQEYPSCQFEGCGLPATDVHHKRGREGENRYKDLMSCCRPHHDLIENDPVLAFEKGYKLTRHWSRETRGE